MRFLSVVIMLLFAAGCSSKPTVHKIQAYGTDRFVMQVLEFSENGKINDDIQKRFKPSGVQKYMDGVLLVYSENRGFIEGVYVDPETSDIPGDENLKVDRWHRQIAWISVKKK